MLRKFSFLFILLVMTNIQCATTPEADPNNPLLKEWSGAFQGLPPFDKITKEDFVPGVESSMAKALQGYKTIANNPQDPTFENTMVPMEKIQLDVDRAMILFGIWSSTLNDRDIQKIEQTIAPKEAEFKDAVAQNAKLFARIDTLYKSRKTQKWTPEQQRLVWFYHTQFVKAGAALNPEQKKQVAKINKRLAELYTKFQQNLLSDEENEALVITKKEDLTGLPAGFVEMAKQEAIKRKQPKAWVISNTRSSMQPFLSYSANRDLREKAFKIFSSRGANENANNNYSIITEVLKLRGLRSKIMGYNSYAQWKLSTTMAKSPDRAMDLLLKVWAPAKAQVAKDVAAMQKIADKEGAKFKIQPWDYRYYAEKLRKQRYDIDMDSVKPYLQVKNIQKAMFWMAKQLYDFQFERLKNIPVYQKDVTVYKVTKNKKTVGLWYFDPYARAGKRSGAWMNAYRIQHRLGGKETLPIVSNNSNFIKGKAGEPTFISWDDASTMFHEFGHALHGLSSEATFPSLAGTNTSRDFVEFPSQIHEDWLSTPEVLKMLTNTKGEPLPKALVAKLKKAATFNMGFATTEYLASALIDMKLHLQGTKPVDPEAFEIAELKSLGMPSEIVMRHRTPQFSHIFSGEGYAAGYYSYMWSDVLRQDAFNAFLEGKGPYDKAVAKKFQKEILSVGNTISPDAAFKNFRGRDPKVDALLKSKGF